MKINEIMEKKFQDFDDQPLNMAPLNTGLTEIEMLKIPHKVLKINLPWLKLSRGFTSVVRFVTWLIN